MTGNPLTSADIYTRFVTELLQHPGIKHSTIPVWTNSRYTGVAEGDVIFTNGFRLRLREELDFDERLPFATDPHRRFVQATCPDSSDGNKEPAQHGKTI